MSEPTLLEVVEEPKTLIEEVVVVGSTTLESVVSQEAGLPGLVESTTAANPSQPLDGDALPSTLGDAKSFMSGELSPVGASPEIQLRTLKRKRGSPETPSLTIEPRVTRSQTVKEASEVNSPTTTTSSQGSKPAAKRKGRGRVVVKKGKGKARQVEDDEEEGQTDVESIASANSAAKLLEPSEDGGSRMPSRAVSVVGSDSGSSLSSPTTHVRPAPTALPSLFHSHTQSFIHHHHGRRPPPPPPPPPAPALTRTQTLPATAGITSETPVDTEAKPPSHSQPEPPLKRGPPSYHSPVTRSNCRFHVISVPSTEPSDSESGDEAEASTSRVRREDVPRFTFIVPGCSLGDAELMKEHDIRDHGFATEDEHRRMVTDIEDLEFDSYLIGVLRQLVGVDLLRLNEVFWLPGPGENLKRKKRRRTTESLAIGLGKGSVSKAKGKSAGGSAVGKEKESSLSKKARKPRASMDLRAFAAGVEGEELPTSSVSAPAGRFSSATPSVLSTKDDDAPSPSPAGGPQTKNGELPFADIVPRREEEEESSKYEKAQAEDDEPQAKRRKLSSPPAESQSTTATAEPSSQPTETPKGVTFKMGKRRSLNPDAQAYKPGAGDEEQESSEEEEEESKQGKKKFIFKKRRNVIVPGTPAEPADPAPSSAVDSVAPTPSVSVAPSAAASDIGGDTPSQPAQDKPSKARKGKRRSIHPDVAAYKPTKDEGEEVDSEELQEPKPRKGRGGAGAGKRGQKRKKADGEAEADGSVTGEQGSKPKKKRTRKSTTAPVTVEVAEGSGEQA